MNPDASDPRYWKRLYSWVAGLGALLSFVFALALMLAAPRVLAAFGVGGSPITWTQLCGELLTLISIFYLPPLLNIDRYRPHGWIAAVVVRGTTGLLCCAAVLGSGASQLFLIWGLTEFAFGLVQVYLLHRLEGTENGRGAKPASEWNGGARPSWNPELPRAVDSTRVAGWKRAYHWVAWIGIGANMIFVLPLVFVPHWMLRMLGVPSEPVIWAQLAGLFLGLVSVFYIPAIGDVDKYRLFAWLAILPSRTAGFTFCTVAVVCLGAHEAFLLGVLLDLPFAFLQTIILARLDVAERALERLPRPSAWQPWWRPIAALLVAVSILGTIGWHKLMREYPQTLVNDSVEEYFKHGSIGAEDAQGLPYWIWVSLPVAFPEYLPKPGGYAALGFIWEPGSEMPVGFTRKRIGFDRVGINCALCHAGSVQVPGEAIPRCYLGAPANTANVLGYQRFLFACAKDPRFNGTTLMPIIARQVRLSLADQALYRTLLIPATRKALLKQSADWEWTNDPNRPEWGPGRIEPFNPVKVSILHGVNPKVVVGETLGTSDMEPLWNLGSHPGRAFHWDGLNTDLREVVDSSALGDGATPTSIPRLRLRELEAWIRNNPAPKFPFHRTVDTNLVDRGAAIYRAQCAKCHAPEGDLLGRVTPAAEVGTDDNRAKMWTPDSATAYNGYLDGKSWVFSHFRSTGGYVNVPLDGLWLRAPYLHNGSVPTLADLLKPVSERPKIFWRGLNEYDPQSVGYVTDSPAARANGFRYDTSLRGNGNQGHTYGTTLPPSDKAALLEYLKQL